MDTWRRQTLVHLLAADDLGMISVWSPTFLLRLMERLEADLADLLAALPATRAREVGAAVERAGGARGAAIWPRLQLISCWTDGTSADYLPALRRWFPRTEIQPKGLLATEGVVSIPMGDEGLRLLALTAHHLELFDVEDGGRRPVSAWELKIGGRYSPVLTTGGGFYRYHLPDVVRCEGFVERAPVVRFEGRLDRVSDRVGEKVHAAQVEAGLAEARAQTGVSWCFALVAPDERDPPGYTWFVESDADEGALVRAAKTLEAHLSQGHHYAYARRLGQLAPLRVRRVRDGLATYERVLVRGGQRLGDLKPTLLDTRTLWGRAFDEGSADAGV